MRDTSPPGVMFRLDLIGPRLATIYGGLYTVESYKRGINLVSTYIHINDKIYEMERVTDKTNLPLKIK
jgi:hypothetical protein